MSRDGFCAVLARVRERVAGREVERVCLLNPLTHRPCRGYKYPSFSLPPPLPSPYSQPPPSLCRSDSNHLPSPLPLHFYLNNASQARFYCWKGPCLYCLQGSRKDYNRQGCEEDF